MQAVSGKAKRGSDGGGDARGAVVVVVAAAGRLRRASGRQQHGHAERHGDLRVDSQPQRGAGLWPKAAPKPIRGASVEIVSGASAAVIATAATDANGAYSVSLPASTQVLVRIKAQMTQGGSGATWDVTVRDNTQSDAIFALETPSFSTGIAAITRDVQAPSGWDGSRYASTRVAGRSRCWTPSTRLRPRCCRSRRARRSRR